MSGYKIIANLCDMIYVYDGSIAGFYCCVYESIYAKELPCEIVTEEAYEPSLFTCKRPETDLEKAAKVRSSIIKNIGARGTEIVEHVFLCHHENKELALLKFLIKGFQHGYKAPFMLGDADVSLVLDMERHLLSENHLLTGFVRFQDYGDMLGSIISPKNFVLPILAEHFISRLPNENFIIYDKTHKAALIYQNKKAEITAIEEIEFAPESEKELYYQSLWKQFYKTIGIKERFNPKCRMTHMPKRYWENMIEMKEYL